VALVAGGENLLESALSTSLALGAETADLHARVVRLEREADALRRLSDLLRSTGATFEREALVGAALEAAIHVLGADAAGLIVRERASAAARARSRGPVGSAPRVAGRGSPRRTHGTRVTLASSTTSRTKLPFGMDSPASRWCAIATVPVESRPTCALVVAMPAPDRGFSEGDVRFLATLAGHLGVGLEKARVHAELESERDRLDETVRERTRALRHAYEDLRALDAAKDRLLAGVSHEMRTPLTAIVSAASFLEDYDGSRASRTEMAGTIREAFGGARAPHRRSPSGRESGHRRGVRARGGRPRGRGRRGSAPRARDRGGERSHRSAHRVRPRRPPTVSPARSRTSSRTP
jgi:K+-sensing histidine kinase KdpD